MKEHNDGPIKDTMPQEPKTRTLAELSATLWLTPQNASFFLKN